MNKRFNTPLVLVIVLIVAVLSPLFFHFLGYVVDNQTRVDCINLQSQEIFTGFYITKDQAQECASIGMTINAPIK